MSEIQNKQSKDKTKNSTTVFADYARYYDLLYRDKDYAAEAEYVADLIRKFQPSARSILELGSGTGKHARLLAGIGFSVHGIERSPEMLAQSSDAAEAFQRDQAAPRLSFSLGDIRTARLPRTFDAVIALFHVVSYQTTNEDVTEVFETARHHLNSGGIFIFDVWYGPAVLTERPAVRIKRMADDQTEITRLAEPVLYPNENRVDVNYHVFIRNLSTTVVHELKETHAMRYFFKPEMQCLAAHAGFKLAHIEEWLTGSSVSSDTWGVCFIFQAL
ncbi:MAG: class I SAM-dependent methyltransferase [Bacteroidales bacterium]|nr:class I SAM-dependent methyltransferase [Bacteroidales bacterium]